MRNLLLVIGFVVVAVAVYDGGLRRGDNKPKPIAKDEITKVVVVGDSIAIQYTINGRTKVLITRK